MANDTLPNDVVRTYTNAIMALNAAGQPVTVPVGSTYTATPDDGNASINIVINAPNFTANAVGPNRVGISVVFAEQGGPPEASFTWIVDTVDDTVPSAVGLNTSTFTDVGQPVPSQTPVTPTPTATPAPGP